MIVKFNQVEEFCDELRKEKDNIERRIVRLTNLYIPSKLSANIRHAKVLATFLVGAFPGAVPPVQPQIVRLERYCGDIWEPGGTDKRALEKAEEVSKKIEAVCQELGLEVRLGVIEDDKHRGN